MNQKEEIQNKLKKKLEKIYKINFKLKPYII